MTEFITGTIANYGQFFSFPVFWETVSNPVNWAVIGTLIVLEGLLSADNALVLAVMVRHLPQNQQKKALFYGIFGAYFFRFLVIGLGTYLITIWWIKAAGALYLLWLSCQYFVLNKGGEDEDAKAEKNLTMGFWRTVLAVELMDIAFSMDSILAAFGVSGKVWVLFLGGILGIMMMRGVAQIFLMLLEKYPTLETTAYVLIAIIGAKMMAAVFGYHVNDTVFFALLAVVFLSTFVIHHLRGEKA